MSTNSRRCAGSPFLPPPRKGSSPTLNGLAKMSDQDSSPPSRHASGSATAMPAPRRAPQAHRLQAAAQSQRFQRAPVVALTQEAQGPKPKRRRFLVERFSPREGRGLSPIAACRLNCRRRCEGRPHRWWSRSGREVRRDKRSPLAASWSGRRRAQRCRRKGRLSVRKPFWRGAWPPPIVEASQAPPRRPGTPLPEVVRRPCIPGRVFPQPPLRAWSGWIST